MCSLFVVAGAVDPAEPGGVGGPSPPPEATRFFFAGGVPPMLPENVRFGDILPSKREAKTQYHVTND